MAESTWQSFGGESPILSGNIDPNAMTSECSLANSNCANMSIDMNSPVNKIQETKSNVSEANKDNYVVENVDIPNESAALAAYKEATLSLLAQVTSDDSTKELLEDMTTVGSYDHEASDSVKMLLESSCLSVAVTEEVVKDVQFIPESNETPDGTDQSVCVDHALVTNEYQSASNNNGDKTDTKKDKATIDLSTSESLHISNIVSVESGSSNTQTSLNISDSSTIRSGQPMLTAVPYVSMSSMQQELNSKHELLATHAHDTDDQPPSKRSKLVQESPKQHNVTEDLFPSQDVVVVTETPVMEEITRQSVFQFKASPRQLTGAWKCFEDQNQKNYLRGCKWAPDGTCLLTNSNDNKLKLFNLPDELYYDDGENKMIPEMNYVLEMKEADTVYDFCWFPLMSSSLPETACFAVTSKDTPVHLYDAFTGELRCSYRAYNHVDEVVAAHSIKFSPDGSKLYCGFNKIIRIFDVTRPGRDFVNRPTFAKEGQRGIISCIDHSPVEHGLYAAGSYSRSIALYSEPDGCMVCMFEGQHGGVTQIMFSPDGTKLYSGGRKDNEILCWDMRNPGNILFTLQRSVVTNQRIYFDITSDSRYVVSGSTDGVVRVWDTTVTPTHPSIHLDPVIDPAMMFEAHKETVNSVSLHPTLPVIATGSGERHFKSYSDNEDDVSKQTEQTPDVDNSLRLWWT